MKKAQVWLLLAVVALAAPFLLSAGASGHAFPDHSEPRVGSTVESSRTASVRIWFDGALEPAFCTIVVQDASGRQVDRMDGRLDPADPTLLEVSLPTLPPGTYRVIWDIVARDGHRTNGDYTFVIK